MRHVGATFRLGFRASVKMSGRVGGPDLLEGPSCPRVQTQATIAAFLTLPLVSTNPHPSESNAYASMSASSTYSVSAMRGETATVRSAYSMSSKRIFFARPSAM